MNETLNVSVDNGKYTVVVEDNKMSALRYGEPWQSLTGNNLVYNLAVELNEARKDADRYRKLSGWMSSNVPEGWEEVERCGAVASWMGWDDMDEYLDTLPECNVGLMKKRENNECV